MCNWLVIQINLNPSFYKPFLSFLLQRSVPGRRAACHLSIHAFWFAEGVLSIVKVIQSQEGNSSSLLTYQLNNEMDLTQSIFPPLPLNLHLSIGNVQSVILLISIRASQRQCPEAHTQRSACVSVVTQSQLIPWTWTLCACVCITHITVCKCHRLALEQRDLFQASVLSVFGTALRKNSQADPEGL